MAQRTGWAVRKTGEKALLHQSFSRSGAAHQSHSSPAPIPLVDLGQGKCDQANPLHVRAIEIGERVLELVHPAVAARLNNRAELLQVRSEIYRHLSAKLLLALTQLGHADGMSLTLCYNRGKSDKADSLYLRMIEIGEKILGVDDPTIAEWINNRAGLLLNQVGQALGRKFGSAPVSAISPYDGLEHCSIA